MSLEILTSTYSGKPDLQFTTRFLANSYWAKGRTLKTIQTLVRSSLNFGIFPHNQEIGCTRVVSDNAWFIYLLDAYISDAYGRKGMLST